VGRDVILEGKFRELLANGRQMEIKIAVIYESFSVMENDQPSASGMIQI
jgi:hypothetical protein